MFFLIPLATRKETKNNLRVFHVETTTVRGSALAESLTLIIFSLSSVKSRNFSDFDPLSAIVILTVRLCIRHRIRPLAFTASIALY